VTSHTLRGVAFLDEEEAFSLEEAPLPPQRGRRGPRAARQQILVRRLIAVGAGVLAVFLIVLGIRGCLNAQRVSAIKSFVTDTGRLMDESGQVGRQFTGLLNNPTGRTVQDYAAQIKSYRGACQSILERGQAISTPSEMSQAKNALVTALVMRRNAMTEIANDIDSALAPRVAAPAQQKISQQMPILYSSDYVWSGVVIPEMQRVLSDQNITTTVPAARSGNFLPEPASNFLNLTTLASDFARVSGGQTSGSSSTVHDLSIVKSTIGSTQLLPGTPVTVSAANPQLAVEVQNAGANDETGVSVIVTIGGSNLNSTIPTIPAGSTKTVKIPITPVPPSGVPTTVQVAIQPASGQASSGTTTSGTTTSGTTTSGTTTSGSSGNSTSTYTVTFQ
jgi:hypothetical protein